jgi:hypothetical protein
MPELYIRFTANYIFIIFVNLFHQIVSINILYFSIQHFIFNSEKSINFNSCQFPAINAIALIKPGKILSQQPLQKVDPVLRLFQETILSSGCLSVIKRSPFAQHCHPALLLLYPQRLLLSYSGSLLPSLLKGGPAMFKEGDVPLLPLLPLLLGEEVDLLGAPDQLRVPVGLAQGGLLLDAPAAGLGPLLGPLPGGPALAALGLVALPVGAQLLLLRAPGQLPGVAPGLARGQVHDPVGQPLGLRLPGLGLVPDPTDVPLSAQPTR